MDQRVVFSVARKIVNAVMQLGTGPVSIVHHLAMICHVRRGLCLEHGKGDRLPHESITFGPPSHLQVRSRERVEAIGSSRSCIETWRSHCRSLMRQL